MTEEQLYQQYQNFLSNRMTKEELELFMLEASRSGNEDLVKKFMDGTWEEMRQFDNLIMVSPERSRIKSGMTVWMRRAVAAAAVLVVGLGLWFLIGKAPRSARGDKEIAATDVVAPQNTKAVITLSDGRQITLDSLTQLAQENVVVRVVDGKVIYSREDGASTPLSMVYNTLTNPRGSKVVDLTLSDGTRVWLNAESSLRYPIAFVGDERIVEITGEVYFEVNGKSEIGNRKSFKVIANGVVIEDLGTEFNVNSYADEGGVKTTLVNGVVKIGASVLKPGQQATNDKITGEVDVQQVVAWKNGLFEFDNTDLSVILRQVARWYDVEVVYEGSPKVGKLGGGLSRNLPLSKVIELLSANGVKLKLEGRRLIVH